MPWQEADDPFTADELLYRRLRADWIDERGQPTSAAIDLTRCSVDRERLAGSPAAALSRGTHGEVAVAAIAFGDIPERYRLDQSPNVYEAGVVHCPEAGNDAHCEIRFRLAGQLEAVKKIGSAAFRAKIREEIAERMRVIYPA